MASLFDDLGGEPVLRRIIDRFVDRVFDDVMIGYLFKDASRARLKEMEYQHAARHLGGAVRYEGKPLREAHAPHPILQGHFNRRRELLRRTLVEEGVRDGIVEHWMAVTEALRGEITAEKCE